MISTRSCLKFFSALQRTCRRNFSDLPPEAVIFADKDMIVCWHPQQSFPYACTKPLPEDHSDSTETSPLKIGMKEVSETFRKKKPDMVVTELAKMTFTTKHRWYPRSRDKRAKKTEMDRTYL